MIQQELELRNKIGEAEKKKEEKKRAKEDKRRAKKPTLRDVAPPPVANEEGEELWGEDGKKLNQHVVSSENNTR